MTTMLEEGKSPTSNFSVVSTIIQELEPLSPDEREHVLRTVMMWYRVGSRSFVENPAISLPTRQDSGTSPRPDSETTEEKFSNRPVLSVKDFILEKEPSTEPERMACLAYYLAHYRDTPHFKTVDLTRLNTEAAQRIFSNPAVASSNAIRDGYLVSAPKAGFKQLSAMGERFVHALPDRQAAQIIKQRMGTRRSKKTATSKSAATADIE